MIIMMMKDIIKPFEKVKHFIAITQTGSDKQMDV